MRDSENSLICHQFKTSITASEFLLTKRWACRQIWVTWMSWNIPRWRRTVSFFLFLFTQMLCILLTEELPDGENWGNTNHLFVNDFLWTEFISFFLLKFYYVCSWDVWLENKLFCCLIRFASDLWGMEY